MQYFSDNISVDGGFDVLDYSYADNRHYGTSVTVKGEVNLWCAVIAQAFGDLHLLHESDEAKRWLLRDNSDFYLVCSLAGVSPVAVRKSALRTCELQLAGKKILELA